MSATTPSKKKRKGRQARGFYQRQQMTDLVIPMELEDRLALRYLQLRLGQPTPQKTVMHLMRSMIMAMRLEDELKAKDQDNADDTAQYTNTAGQPVDPAAFADAQAADVDGVPAAVDAVVVADTPADLDVALAGDGTVYDGPDANICDDGSRADGN